MYSICSGTFLNDETGAQLKSMFMNTPQLADIIFNVEGKKVYAHQIVLSTRCDVMAAMFGGLFREGTSTNDEV